MRLLLILFLFLPVSSLAATEYRLDLQLQPDRRQLVARAQIRFDPDAVQTQRLLLSPRCRIDEIRQDGQPLKYRENGGILMLTGMSAAELQIDYQCAFEDSVPQAPAHNENPSYGVAATISPRGTYLSSGVYWYPRPADDAVIYQVHISAPSGTEAITSGRRLSHRTEKGQSSSSWQIDYPLRGLTLSAGPLQLFEETSGKIPIYAYFSEANAPLAAGYLKQARSDLYLYAELFGPYPFHKFAIVENFFPTGYGLPSWTLLGSSVIRLPFIVKTSLGHEIAHSWWGVGVQADYSRGNWAEGLTTYVADHLYKEHSSVAEAAEYRQNILRDYANLVTADKTFAVEKFNSRYDKVSQVIGYGKAAMIFHMLRKKVGDELFWTGLRQIAHDRMHDRISWNDFEPVYSQLSDQDLTSFFHQWLTRTNGPQLALKEVVSLKTDNGWQVRGQLVQTPPSYQLTVPLELTTTAGVVSQQIDLEGAATTFSMTTTGQPLRLQADPRADLFRILDPEELPATINSIRGSDQLVVLRAGRNAPNDAAIKTLLAGMRKADLPIQDFSELDQAELAKNDLLIFGLSEDLQPPQLTAEEGGRLALSGQSLDPANQSVFVASKSPLNPAHVVAWFISEGSQSAVVARKIPHYGKYSYLLFDGVKNRQKRINMPETSALKVDFSTRN